MKSSKFWLAVLAAGVLMNVVDFLFYTQWLGPKFMMSNTTLFRQDTNPAWFIVGDFVAVFVFAWVFDRVSGAFGSTAKDGAMAGMYLGVLVNFPTYIFMYLMFNGYPYALSWISTIYGIIWYVVVGAVVAAMMKKGSAAATA